MTRKRSDTIGSLGRAPARAPTATGVGKPPAPPVEPPHERFGIRKFVHGALFENLGLKFLSMVLAITVHGRRKENTTPAVVLLVISVAAAVLGFLTQV